MALLLKAPCPVEVGYSFPDLDLRACNEGGPSGWRGKSVDRVKRICSSELTWRRQTIEWGPGGWTSTFGQLLLEVDNLGDGNHASLLCMVPWVSM